MKRIWVLLPLICIAGCRQPDYYMPPKVVLPIAVIEKVAPVTLVKRHSSPSLGRLVRSVIAPMGDAGGKVWLLFFERKISKKDRTENKKFALYTGSDGPITLLAIDDKGLLLRTIPIGLIQGQVNEIKFRWLQPDKNQGPVVIVRRNPPESISALEAIAFPSGWSQRTAVRQVFNEWGNISQRVTYTFDIIDDKGFLAATQNITNYGESAPTPSGTDGGKKFQSWNGKGWSE